MIARAMGPQNTDRVRGIIARMAASAVRTTGRARRTVLSTMASQGARPAARSWSIWSTKITEFLMIIPASAMTPRSATKPNGAPATRSAATAPIAPSGAVSSTSASLEKLRSCTMRRASVPRIMAGKTANREALALALSSTAPPISRRTPPGSDARNGASAASSWAETVGGWIPGRTSPRTVRVSSRLRRQRIGSSVPGLTVAS
jgi:hypothetical protein